MAASMGIQEQPCLQHLDYPILLIETEHWPSGSENNNGHISHTLRLVTVAAWLQLSSQAWSYILVFKLMGGIFGHWYSLN